MTRKSHNSFIDDLFHIAKRLPSWFSLILSVISYLFFHSIAISEVDTTMQSGSRVTQYLPELLFKSLSVGLQYIIPAVFFLGSAISVFKAFQGKSLAKLVSSGSASFKRPYPAPKTQPTKPDATSTTELTWQQFELLVGQAFRQQGYTVIDGGEYGADGGIDVSLKKDGKLFLVQCKHWKTQRVGVAVIREFFGVITAAKAAGGFVETSGDFTSDAKAFADSQAIDLINGDALESLLCGRRKEVVALAPVYSPACPKCRAAMAKRIAKRGTNTGKSFWGCSRYPNCRGIRN